MHDVANMDILNLERHLLEVANRLACLFGQRKVLQGHTFTAHAARSSGVIVKVCLSVIVLMCH